jgi:phage shock protein A
MVATEARLARERAELETVRRRQGLAGGIGDTETVAIAEKFAVQHGERIAMLETKLMAQQQELTVADRELDDMASQLRMAMAGVDTTTHGPDASARREVDDLLNGRLDAELDSGDQDTAPARRSRAEREADAEDRLAALKRRMGK